MADNEVKPSFSPKYLFLVLLTSAIVGGGTFLVDYIMGNKPVRKLVVYEEKPLNLIDDDHFDNSQIEEHYFLKNSKRNKIKSLFNKKIIIKNVGNEGVEDLTLTFLTDTDKAFLIKNPKIESQPESTKKVLNLKKQDNLSSENKHTWIIPLLNKEESLIFEYKIYSEEKIENISFSAIPRKNNWEVNYEDFLTTKKEENIPLLALKQSSIILFSFLSIFLLFAKLMWPVYRKEWERNESIREKYKDLKEYYDKQWPPPLIQ